MVLNFETISSKVELILSNLGWHLQFMSLLLFLATLARQATNESDYPPQIFSFQANHAVWSLMQS